jgi:hypothetical protein
MIGVVHRWEWCCALGETVGRTSRKDKGSRMGLQSTVWNEFKM